MLLRYTHGPPQALAGGWGGKLTPKSRRLMSGNVNAVKSAGK